MKSFNRNTEMFMDDNFDPQLYQEAKELFADHSDFMGDFDDDILEDGNDIPQLSFEDFQKTFKD